MTAVQYVSEPFTYIGGGLAVGVQVTVYLPGSFVKAPIWHDSGLSRAVNPRTTDDAGQVSFYAEPGDYDLAANGFRFTVTVDGLPPAVGDGVVLAYSVDAGSGAGVGDNPLYNDTGQALRIESIRASAGTVTGSPLVVDVLKNGVTVFTNPASRPSLAVGADRTLKVTPEVTEVLDGEFFTVNVAASGSYANLVVQIQLK